MSLQAKYLFQIYTIHHKKDDSSVSVVISLVENKFGSHSRHQIQNGHQTFAQNIWEDMTLFR